MQVYEIMKDVFWVGAVDWGVRDFHGYSTYEGSTYNAFLLLDEKVVLFDTVKKEFTSDLIHRIRTVIDPERIDYIVVNHVEMDHSGALPEIVELARPEKIICSPMGEKNLKAHFHRDDWPYHVVKTGDSISTGKRTIQFIETRMLHWPDSMFSFIPQDGLLISSDAFGQHLASSGRFDDEVDETELMYQARKYYANIITLYSPQVRKLLDSVAGMGLDIRMIAPDHGVIWRKDPGKILKAYSDWAHGRAREKCLVIYDTMWHSTEFLAKAVADGIEGEGVEYELMDLAQNHRSDVMTEVLDAKGIALGSPTLNNGLLPRMAGFVEYMKGLRPFGKLGVAFGSYGWSGESVRILEKAMEAMKFEIAAEGLRVKYVPGHEELRAAKELGRTLAVKVKEALASE